MKPPQYVITETRGPIPTIEDLSLPMTPESIHSRIERFECPHCGKPWQRAIGEGPPFEFRQPQTCGIEGNPGCGAILPGDLEPGDLVDLSEWDKDEPPRSRFGVSVVVDMVAIRNCQSGYLVRIARRDDPTTPIARLDRAWLKKIKPPSKGRELWED